MIDCQKVTSLTGFTTSDAFKNKCRFQVEISLESGEEKHQPDWDWSESIVVGSREFAKEIKEHLGYSKGRKLVVGNGTHLLREEIDSYTSHFDGEMEDIGAEKTYQWSINHSTSVT